jgi:diguanylate cyclase (GGDEF)-like protein
LLRLNIENSTFRVRSGQERRKTSRSADRRKGTKRKTPSPRTSAYISVTVSIGVAESRSRASVDEVIEEADQALYRAKRGGRNRIEIAVMPKPIRLVRSNKKTARL